MVGRGICSDEAPPFLCTSQGWLNTHAAMEIAKPNVVTARNSPRTRKRRQTDPQGDERTDRGGQQHADDVRLTHLVDPPADRCADPHERELAERDLTGHAREDHQRQAHQREQHDAAEEERLRVVQQRGKDHGDGDRQDQQCCPRPADHRRTGQLVRQRPKRGGQRPRALLAAVGHVAEAAAQQQTAEDDREDHHFEHTAAR